MFHTLLPHKSFIKSAQCLDWRRLGAQRVKNLQLMQELLGWRIASEPWVEIKDTDDPYYDSDEPFGLIGNDAEEAAFEARFLDQILDYERVKWVFSPIPTPNPQLEDELAKWRGHEWALLDYQRAIIDEWILRGYIDTCWYKTRALYIAKSHQQLPKIKPAWLGDEEFHNTQRLYLIRKDPDHYRPLFPDVPDRLPLPQPPV